MNDMSDRFLSIGTIARRLSVTSKTVREWIRSGKLAATRTLTGRDRVREADLDAALTKINSNEPNEPNESNVIA